MFKSLTIVCFVSSGNTKGLLDAAEDDPTEDPEYNFLQEVDSEVPDMEDLRDDRAVRVSSKTTFLL